MKKSLLKIRGLVVEAGGKEILKGLDLEIKSGETHILLGQNGAGKSTLARVIMGDPEYKVVSGEIWFLGQNITELKTHERARLGLFLSFQAPEEISGISLDGFVRATKKAYTGEDESILAFKKELKEKMKELNIPENYAMRQMNVGFSGGEKKKNEILQMEMLNPKLAILDEIDSGLDIDAVKEIQKRLLNYRDKDNSLLIVTHVTKMLDGLPIDFVHILKNGKIEQTRDASIIAEISKDGFRAIE